MARTFCAAFAAVRALRRINVYSRAPERRERFAREMELELGVEVVPHDDPAKAAEGADILATCTDSMTPTIAEEWLEPGMHVANLGPYEISPDVSKRFDIVVRQGEEGLPMEETPRYQRGIGHSFGAYLAGTEDELRRLPPKSVKPPSPWPTFVDMATGRAAGRTSSDQITHYHAIGNFGLQFSSVGAELYRRVKAKGLGRQLPTEWFLQDIRN